MATFGKRGITRTSDSPPRTEWPLLAMYGLLFAGAAYLLSMLFIMPPDGAGTVASDCERGRSASGAVVGVRGADGHPLLQSPDGGRIVNRKATEVLGETHYQSIDNSTTVQVQCLDGEWARVQIVEPEWLRAHRGWVKRNVLEDVSPDGFRTFTEEHFAWYSSTAQAKEGIIKAVNRLHREDKRCAKSIQPPSVAKSPSETERRGIPVYYINCGSGDDLVNVYFVAE